MQNCQIINTSTFIKPVRQMTEYIETIKIYEDRRVERIRDYSIFPDPENMIDGKSLLNVYGQKIANDLYTEKIEQNNNNNNANITLKDLEEDEVFNGNIRCDYSDL